MGYFEQGDWIPARRGNDNGQQGNVPAWAKDNWGTWTDRGEEYALVPVDSVNEPIGITDALSRVIAAKVATRSKPEDGGLNWIDKRQKALVGGINKGIEVSSRIFHFKPELVDNPFPGVIREEVDSIKEQYSKLLPESAKTPSEIDREIDQDTRTLMHRLESGDLDNDYETTDDERKVALDLTAMVGTKSASDIQKALKQYVFGRGADIVSARHGNSLAWYQQELANGMARLGRVPQSKWFAVDWLTSNLLLTPQERQVLKNTVWAITPKELKVRRIDRFSDDRMRYPLSIMDGKSPNGLYFQDGTPDAVDRIRALGGPFLQPAINEWARTGLGGLVVVKSLQRSDDVVRFPVRAPDTSADDLSELASIASGYNNTLEMMTRAIREPEAAYAYPLRQNKIMELLPSPLVTEINFRLRNGQVDWASGLPYIAEIKRELNDNLKTSALRAVAEMTPDGAVPRKVELDIANYKKQLDRWNQNEQLLRKKINPPTSNE